mmetsp:Transcript_18018/g.34395  ORF Transcript_18018/g.34395 Transcript_18018/m.34395 type:complete len:211 (+) Transcript_18018:99-731(+)
MAKRKPLERGDSSPKKKPARQEEGSGGSSAIPVAAGGGRGSSSLIFCPNDVDAVDKVSSFFGLTPKNAQLAVDLAKSLKVDDPGIFVTFRDGTSIRANLRRNGDGKPCAAGANGGQALQNLKDWLTSLVPQGKQQFIKHSGANGIGIGNLTQDEFTELQSALSFTTPVPPSSWVLSMFSGGHSLGGVLSVTGTGVGQATMSKSPSTIFSD